MRLFIAEKPSLGRAIADVLPKPLRKSEGFIVAANGDTVSWCIGHLLEQAEPQAYDPAYKKWSHEHLPIVPKQWQLVTKKRTAKQFNILKKLVKQADQLVHAGDPDREGQLLVDELINHVGLSKTKIAATQRCLISDLNTKAVKRAVSSLRSNQDFIPLSVSALARSRADWLYGINLTRAYTLQGQKAGYQGVLSVGRVQTPVLGLVVRRDKAIEEFTSKPFYEVLAELQTLLIDGEPSCFKAKWRPSKECQPYLDESGRNLSNALADNVAKRISQQDAEVKKIERAHRKPLAPLPFSLSALQIEANKAYGFSAQKVLDVCQSLYEKHKLITYPRSDCRHLPKEHWSEAKQVIETIQTNAKTDTESNKLFGTDSDAAKCLNLKLKGRAWNDAKVTAHHAIIPTQKKLNSNRSNASLSEYEQKIYRLICRNYVAQFLPRHEFYEVTVEVNIGGGVFIAKAKEAHTIGWKCLFPSNKAKDKDGADQQDIPPLTLGQRLRSLDASVIEKNTSPPKAYTDASLLAAMTGINAYVNDPDLKKILRDTDGLGTDATRAGIIELLFKRKFLRRQGKQISATQNGIALVDALPKLATTPDLTAQWEFQLSAIHEGNGSYLDLMTPLQSQISSMVVESKTVLPQGLIRTATKSRFNKANSKSRYRNKSKNPRNPSPV